MPASRSQPATRSALGSVSEAGQQNETVRTILLHSVELFQGLFPCLLADGEQGEELLSCRPQRSRLSSPTGGFRQRAFGDVFRHTVDEHGGGLEAHLLFKSTRELCGFL